jgi:hypothetical protein
MVAPSVYGRLVIDELSDEGIELLKSAAVATIASINADGSPHLSAAWIGLVTHVRIDRISGVGPWRRATQGKEST